MDRTIKFKKKFKMKTKRKIVMFTYANLGNIILENIGHESSHKLYRSATILHKISKFQPQ